MKNKAINALIEMECQRTSRDSITLLKQWPCLKKTRHGSPGRQGRYTEGCQR